MKKIQRYALEIELVHIGDCEQEYYESIVADVSKAILDVKKKYMCTINFPGAVMPIEDSVIGDPALVTRTIYVGNTEEVTA